MKDRPGWIGEHTAVELPRGNIDGQIVTGENNPPTFVRRLRDRIWMAMRRDPLTTITCLSGLTFSAMLSVGVITQNKDLIYGSSIPGGLVPLVTYSIASSRV